MKCFGAFLVLASSAWSFSPQLNKPKVSATSLYGEFGASSTSFYTKTEKKDSYESLEAVLEAKCKDEKVRGVIKDMLDVCADITEALRTALVTVEGSMNDFGDAQLSVDVSVLWSTSISVKRRNVSLAVHNYERIQISHNIEYSFA